MLYPALLTGLLLAPLPAQAAPAPANPAISAEVTKGVAAYNAQDLKYYEAALAPDAVYIADDGMTFSGKESVTGLFGRLFAATPHRTMEISDLATGGRGDVAWARFKWTITRGETSRKGLCSILFTRAGDGWQAVQIQNTPDGHGAPGAHH
jgi:ketosteroid isomerase-like protein